MNQPTIMASDEAWDERTLGADENFVKVADVGLTDSLDEAAGTQLISIRLQKSLIEDFKMIASLNNGLGYQTLMKQILKRFAESEKKRILSELISEKLKERQKAAGRAASRKAA